jgi:hypothetical protein
MDQLGTGPARTGRASGSRLLVLAALAALGVAGLLAAACSGGNPTSPSGSANLRLMLTDAPIDDVDEVNIYFTNVTAKPVGEPPVDLTLSLQTNPVDLLTLTDDITGFAAGAVPPGQYEFIHINIDQSRSHVVEDGVEKPLRVPSREIKVLNGFTVDQNNLTTLTLDFDAKASLVSLGNGDWLLKPVVVVTGNDTSTRP